MPYVSTFNRNQMMMCSWDSFVDPESIARLIDAFVNSLDVSHAGNTFTITVGNPVHYASFVELGHRQTVGRYVPAIGKCLKRAWVPGQFMLKISEDELQSQTPAILARNIEKWLMKIGG